MITRNPAGWHGFSPKGPTVRGAPAPSITLTPSGPVVFTSNGQTIENLHITGNASSHAVFNNGFTDCILKNCKVAHITSDASGNYHGIRADNAHRMLIEDTEVTHNGTVVPIVKEEDNIVFVSCNDIIVRRLRLSNGSNGVYLIGGSGGHFSFIEGYNFRNIGNGPRGALIQFNAHTSGTIEDFSAFMDLDETVSYAGDIVSFIQAHGGAATRGLIDGNNSWSGVGLMMESCNGITVTDVDAIHQGAGAFSNWPFDVNPACTNIVLTRCRTRDAHDTDLGRGVPASCNAVLNVCTTSPLQFASTPANGQCTLNSCEWYNQPRLPLATYWMAGGFVAVADPANISEVDFTPRAPIVNSFDWE